jgi:glycosyltransferase involved in cell wall biosynthesis
VSPRSDAPPRASTAALPRVLIVGGVDVRARIPLMERLADEFELVAVGAGAEPAFEGTGFRYLAYAPGQAARVSPLDDARAFFALARIFRAERPRIVHAFDTKAGVWGCLAARLAGVPSAVGTVNGLGFLFRSDTWKQRLLSKSYQALQTLACAASSATVFQNPDDARVFVEAGMARREKVVLVPGSGVRTDLLDPARFAPEARAALRQALGIGPEDVAVIMVTRVIRSKGVLDLLAAARALRASDPRLRFVLVGAHEPDSMDRLSEPELESLRRELIWTGPRRDVPALLAAADLMAFPSGYGEGIPRVLLEAASMALPIVTTDSPGCREVVVPGANGFLVPIGDAGALASALGRLAGDAALRARLGANGRARAVERFDLGVVVERTRSLYRELLAHGAVRGVAAGSLA